MTRTNLKVFRIRRGLSQEQIAKKIGCIRATYSAIENGKRSGRATFWNSFQKAFDVSDSHMWELMQDEAQTENQDRVCATEKAD